MNKKAIAIVLVLALMLSTACGAAIKEEVAVEVDSQTTAVPTTTIATTTTTIVTTTTTEAERLSHAETLDLLIAFNDLSESLIALMSIKFDTDSLPLSMPAEDKIAIIATHIGFLERHGVILDAALDLFTPYSESDLGFTLADQAAFLIISYDLQELAQEVLDAPTVYD